MALLIGVGTHTKITSLAARSASSLARIARPRPRAEVSIASPMSSIGECPAWSSLTRLRLASTPRTVQPASTKLIASGRPT